MKEGLKPYLATTARPGRWTAWRLPHQDVASRRICAQELLLADMCVGAINVA
jgi:hypothetical protein